MASVCLPSPRFSVLSNSTRYSNAAQMPTPHLMPGFWLFLLNERCISTYIPLKILNCAKYRPAVTWRSETKKKNKLNLVCVRSYSICAISIQAPRRNKHGLLLHKTKASLERQNLLSYKTNPREIYPSGLSATDEWVELSRPRELLKWSASITTVSYVLVVDHSLSG